MLKTLPPPVGRFTEVTILPTPASLTTRLGRTIDYQIWRRVVVVRFRGPGSEGLAYFEGNSDGQKAV